VALLQASRITFWSWYRRSARTDGALVSAPRRAFGFSIGIALLISSFIWLSRTQPNVTRTISMLARRHPICFLELVFAFVLISFRGTALEYLSYSVYQAQGVHLKRVLFFGIGESELRRRYEETFGKDKYLRAPGLCACLALLVFAASCLTLVFSSP